MFRNYLFILLFFKQLSLQAVAFAATDNSMSSNRTYPKKAVEVIVGNIIDACENEALPLVKKTKLIKKLNKQLKKRGKSLLELRWNGDSLLPFYLDKNGSYL